MLKQKSMSGLLVVAAIVAVTAFVMPSTADAANCTWTRQELVDKHVAGLVFTDLAGPNKAGKGEMTVRNNSDPATGCNAVESLAAYSSTDSRPPLHQKFFSLATVSVAPGETKTVRVSVPTCMYQIDAYADVVGQTDQVNINEIPVLYGEVVGSNLCDAPVVTTTPVPAPCVLDGQNLIEAHLHARTVFTDLAGANKAGKGEITIQNDSNCEVHETFGSYRSTTTRPPANQKVIEVKHLTVAPHSRLTARVATVDCDYQIDAFAGFAPATDQTDVGQFPIIYGEVVERGGVCDKPAAAPSVAPTVIVNSVTNNNTNNNESRGGNAEITNSGNARIGNITLSQSKPAATQVVYASYAKAPVAVPITAKTGPEALALVASLSTGSGLLWTIKRLIK